MISSQNTPISASNSWRQMTMTYTRWQVACHPATRAPSRSNWANRMRITLITARKKAPFSSQHYFPWADTRLESRYVKYGSILFNLTKFNPFDIYLQYYVYDLNSFIADVGGYLGLLLGQSCLGMYHLIVTPSNWETLQKYIRHTNKGTW